MITVIVNGEAHRQAVEALEVGVEIIDAAGCVVIPGFIDPHEQSTRTISSSGKKHESSE